MNNLFFINEKASDLSNGLAIVLLLVMLIGIAGGAILKRRHTEKNNIKDEGETGYE